MSDYRRRRFITDLLFVGGALTAAAGLASTGEAQSQTPSPSPTCKKPEPGTVPTSYPMAGAPLPPPPPPQKTVPNTHKREPRKDR